MHSRPTSHAFPAFHSNLSYTLVRDFAYAVVHPLHYGPPPETPSRSGESTPISEAQRVPSESSRGGHNVLSAGWSAGPWGSDGAVGAGDNVIPQILYQDGPPWSEDEDLQSPIVVTSRHKKHKSSGGALASSRPRRRDPSTTANPSGDAISPIEFRGRKGRHGESFLADPSSETTANEPNGEFITLSKSPSPFEAAGQRVSHFAATSSHRSYAHQRSSPSGATKADHRPTASDVSSSSSTEDEGDEARSSGGFNDDGDDESRYSRDYQFTIASPDEEMHGKAVALFDFARENENELPLVEGQVIWVSYRHGQGWLVAEDPKTQESGLVPEEYVRLLRDIQGGLGSLTGDLSAAAETPDSHQQSTAEPNPSLSSAVSAASAVVAVASHNTADMGTPTQAHPHPSFHFPLPIGAGAPDHSASVASTNGTNGYQHPPTVSIVSTSSKDLDLYPPHLLGPRQGEVPPQVVHYHGQRGGSQTNTPTLTTSKDLFASAKNDIEIPDRSRS